MTNYLHVVVIAPCVLVSLQRTFTLCIFKVRFFFQFQTNVPSRTRALTAEYAWSRILVIGVTAHRQDLRETTVSKVSGPAVDHPVYGQILIRPS